MLRLLLRSDVADQLGRLHKARVAPSAKQREEFLAARAARPKLAATLAGARKAASSDPENYAVVGNVAQICVDGVLSEEPDFWAWLFGMDGTTYSDIRDAFAIAASDPLVKSVVLAVSSPGGYCEGLFETLAAIEAFGKPVTVQASQACSAAYALAAMAGPITALGPASEFGSIGVACSFAFDADTEIVDVTSTEAPNKRPDPRTPEGKAVIVAELDAIHDLFVDAIARGRSKATGKDFTVEQVNADFGRGGTMLSDAAKGAGLIDKMPRAPKVGANAEAENGDEEPLPMQAPSVIVAPVPLVSLPPAAAAGAPQQPSPPRSAGPIRTKKMDEAAFKAQHPELFAAITGAAKASGVAEERDRVGAHLTMGETSGDMKTAIAAITSGDTMTQTLTAKYLAAGMNRNAVAARQTETDAAGKIVAGAAPAPGDGGKDLQDTVAEMMAKARGNTAA